MNNIKEECKTTGPIYLGRKNVWIILTKNVRWQVLSVKEECMNNIKEECKMTGPIWEGRMYE